MIDGELIVDNFAGGGGASTGIEIALGDYVDIAINHDPAAIAMHKANHPNTKHYCESVWDVNPVEACAGRPVGLAWFSPDCKHFSKAKGGKPVEKKIRGLAWIVLKWAALVKPRVIMLENVEEFQTWGPVRKGQPVKSKKGLTYKKWREQLESLGYVTETKELVACDYGAPTKRKRFFMIARCDGKQIVWPEPTHAPADSLEVYAGIKEKYIPVAECIDWSIPCKSIFGRSKPLAENTMKRIAKGLQKFVFDNPEPFVVTVNHGGDNFRGQSINDPLHTVTAKHGYGVVMPYIVQYHAETTKNEVRGQKMNEPIMTLDGSNRYALVSFISKYFSRGYTGAGTEIREPLSTVTTIDHNALCSAHIIQMNHNSVGSDMREPVNTIVAGQGHIGEVRAFLIKYYGGQEGGHSINAPIDTITSKDRFGLVTINGSDYQIVDIGLRMLEPHELFKAQGFPDGYKIAQFSKKEQVAKCGNAVCPPIATALVRANLPELCKCEEAV